jgi:preprotein translocase subunit SecA
MEYKGEAFKQFKELITEINRESVEFAFKYFPQVVERKVRTDQPAPEASEDDGLPRLRSNAAAEGSMRYEHSESNPAFIAGGGPQPPQVQQAEGSEAGAKVKTYKRRTEKVGRNDPCPCGSGKKYKKCCGKNA